MVYINRFLFSTQDLGDVYQDLYHQNQLCVHEDDDFVSWIVLLVVASKRQPLVSRHWSPFRLILASTVPWPAVFMTEGEDTEYTIALFVVNGAISCCRRYSHSHLKSIYDVSDLTVICFVIELLPWMIPTGCQHTVAYIEGIWSLHHVHCSVWGMAILSVTMTLAWCCIWFSTILVFFTIWTRLVMRWNMAYLEAKQYMKDFMPMPPRYFVQEMKILGYMDRHSHGHGTRKHANTVIISSLSFGWWCRSLKCIVFSLWWTWRAHCVVLDCLSCPVVISVSFNVTMAKIRFQFGRYKPCNNTVDLLMVLYIACYVLGHNGDSGDRRHIREWGDGSRNTAYLRSVELGAPA